MVNSGRILIACRLVAGIGPDDAPSILGMTRARLVELEIHNKLPNNEEHGRMAEVYGVYPGRLGAWLLSTKLTYVNTQGSLYKSKHAGFTDELQHILDNIFVNGIHSQDIGE